MIVEEKIFKPDEFLYAMPHKLIDRKEVWFEEEIIVAMQRFASQEVKIVLDKIAKDHLLSSANMAKTIRGFYESKVDKK